MPSRRNKAVGPDGREESGNERFVFVELSRCVGQHDRCCFKKPILQGVHAETRLNDQAVPLEGNRANVPTGPPGAVPGTVNDRFIFVPLARDGNHEIRYPNIRCEFTKPVRLCRCRLGSKRRAIARDQFHSATDGLSRTLDSRSSSLLRSVASSPARYCSSKGRRERFHTCATGSSASPFLFHR